MSDKIETILEMVTKIADAQLEIIEKLDNLDSRIEDLEITILNINQLEDNPIKLRLTGKKEITMDITTALAGFLTLSNIFLCVILFLITFVFRKIVEFIIRLSFTIDKNSKFQKIVTYLWRECLLPIMSPIMGGIFGYFVNYPTPAEFTTKSSKLVFFVICGLLSSWIYPRVKWYFDKISEIRNNNKKDDDDSPILPLGDVLPKIDDLGSKIDSPK